MQNYAKQSQFWKWSNECNFIYNKGLWKYYGSLLGKKQSQNKAKQSQSFDKLRTSFWKSRVDIKLIISRDYEKYIYCKGHLVRRRRISENKPKQSQSPPAISPKTCAWGNYPLSSLIFCQRSSISSLMPEPVTAEIDWIGCGSFFRSSLTIL